MTRAPQGSPDDLLTAADTARILGVSADMARLLARTGRLVRLSAAFEGAGCFDARASRCSPSSVTERRKRMERGNPAGGDR